MQWLDERLVSQHFDPFLPAVDVLETVDVRSDLFPGEWRLTTRWLFLLLLFGFAFLEILLLLSACTFEVVSTPGELWR